MAVEFLIEKLKQQAVAHLFSDEVEKLDSHLRRFKALPKQPSRKKLTELIGRIRDAVYETEDAIDDAYVIQNNPVNFPVNTVRTAVEGIEALLEDIIRCIYTEKKSTTDSDDDSDVEDGGTAEINQEHPVKEQNVVVGIKDEVEVLSKRLIEESMELQVLSIVGMAGLGKTILSQKIFHDARIVRHFPIRIWVYVSQSFTPKEIFLHILNYFTLLSDDINSKNDKELADLVVGFLKNERFLLVMDDLWSPEDWDKLKVALPTSNKMGRVLITSRIMKVCRHANSNRHPHEMRFLNEEESFQLFELEVLRGEELPLELGALGRVIALRCRGHPLAIVLIAGILVKELSSDTRTVMAAWKKVSVSLTSMMHGDQVERMPKIIAMSYEKLPYQLRECFLYFGMFPEDFEIPIWKLIRLWIGEGFIQQNVDVSLEETAENYLQELIDRNLVKGVKFKLNGTVKACRAHDLILDFCITEAARDGFFQQIKMSDDGGFRHPVHEDLKFRRLCIHSNALNFVSKKPNGLKVRSFVCSSREKMDMPMKDLSTIPKGFKLLKVLDVEPINFNLKLPRDLFQLLCLRYLFVSVRVDVLPLAFSQLRNIQTLVFDTSTRTLEIRADILNLSQLRHFKTKASATLPETSASSLTTTASENFQTLGTISPESCTKIFFDRARNLKKLGVRGNLALLLDGENESFESLGKLEKLEKLKLLNDVFPIPPSGFPVLSLPPPYKFPPKLKILTLSRTCLDWCHMSIIESLENLEVLKLENKAFVGFTWEVSDVGFRRLEVLRIERLNLMNWLASDNQFPKLKHLQLRHCDDLQGIPVELVDVPSFVKLELFHCKRAAASARELEAMIEREFNLSISPFQE